MLRPYKTRDGYLTKTPDAAQADRSCRTVRQLWQCALDLASRDRIACLANNASSMALISLA
jgi:hypothetical protein